MRLAGVQPGAEQSVNQNHGFAFESMAVFDGTSCLEAGIQVIPL